MTREAYQQLLEALNQECQPLDPAHANLDALLEHIGDARLVLLGEATHGTHEFYQIRAQLSQRLIAEKGFMAVAIECDWPDAYPINRYLQGQLDSCNQALAGFKRFPNWLWRNHIVNHFLQWLRSYNLDNNKTIRFYGLDLYSLHASIEAVINYLQQRDEQAAERAKQRYSCFNRCTQDPESYAYLCHSELKQDCIQAVTEQLLELQHHAFTYLHEDSIDEAEAYFYAMQNARVVKSAEAYYRTMFSGHISSWNLRDQHMFESLNAIANHLESCYQQPAKIIVWAHNSHIGDARATEMGTKGEINIGQLAREQYGFAARLIGFSTYTGTVTAAPAWGETAQCESIIPSLPGSYEELFHQTNQPNFLLTLTHGGRAEQLLHFHRLQRAIGVIYRPETERHSHYFFSRLPYQFDAIIHIDKTHALQPLNHHDKTAALAAAETYPTGL